MSKQYKTVYQVCDGANFPAFNTLAEAEAYLTKMDRVTAASPRMPALLTVPRCITG